MVLNDARQFAMTQAASAEAPSAGEMHGVTGMMASAMPAGVRNVTREMQHGAPILKPSGTSLIAGCHGRASHLLASVSELCPAALERLLL